jgi:hypothetical protein
MIKWIKEINWAKTIIVGLLYTVFAVVVQRFVSWSNVGIMSTVITLATGISIAIIYYYLKDILPKKILKRVFFFADLMIACSFVFFTMPAYVLFNVPVGLLVRWFISSFIILVYMSFITVKIIGR